MSTAHLRKLVTYMRQIGETELALDDGSGQAVQIQLVPAPVPAHTPAPNPTVSECAACRALLRLWTAVLPQPLGNN